MTEVLTQDEIDQLFKAINAGEEPEDFRPALDARKIKIYDFKRPDKFTKEQIRFICVIHESFSRELTSLLSTYFRKTIHVHVASVDQLTYEEFIRSIPTPTTLAVLNVEPLKGGCLLEIDPAVTHAMINRLFGGEGDNQKDQHELTALEMKITEDMINDNFLTPLHNSWSKIVDMKPVLARIETNPQFCQIVPPSEMVVLITLECTFGDVEGVINLCLPYLTITPILGRLTAEFWYTGVEKKNERLGRVPSLNETLNKICIPITVELGHKSVPLAEIREMGEGTILELDKLAGEPVDVFAGGEHIGFGEVVVIDENFGVRITDLVGK